MKNRVGKLLCAGVAVCLLLSGCRNSASVSQPQGEQEGGVTFTDDLGRTVTVKSPQRVAALIGSFADLWCLAGGGDTLVAAANDAWTSFDLDLGDGVVNLGAVKEPSLEQLLAAEPDLVLASSNTSGQTALEDTFLEMGLTVAYFKVTNFQEYLNMLDLCTQMTGQRERYDQYGRALQDRVDAAKGRADGTAPTVLYVRATGASCKVKSSQDSVLGEMLADLGGVNIADSDAGLLEQLSMETILDRDPDFIFAVLQGADPTAAERVLDQTLLSNPAWQSLTAVREGRYHVLDDRLYNLKPNARWGEAYEKLSEILYPDKEA